MFRRAEAGEERAVLRDARAVNDKVRLLAKVGAALIEAKENGADLDGAVAASVGWEKLAASVAEAERLAWPDKVDLPALAARAWPVLHRLGSAFLAPLHLRAVPATAPPLRAVELLHGVYGSGGRRRPKDLPTTFCARPGATRRGPGKAKGPPSTAAPGRRPPCSHCATGCARATSGLRAAGSGGPSRTSSSRCRCSRPCAK